jgi:hypothetical protein
MEEFLTGHDREAFQARACSRNRCPESSLLHYGRGIARRAYNES